MASSSVRYHHCIAVLSFILLVLFFCTEHALASSAGCRRLGVDALNLRCAIAGPQPPQHLHHLVHHFAHPIPALELCSEAFILPERTCQLCGWSNLAWRPLPRKARSWHPPTLTPARFSLSLHAYNSCITTLLSSSSTVLSKLLQALTGVDTFVLTSLSLRRRDVIPQFLYHPPSSLCTSQSSTRNLFSSSSSAWNDRKTTETSFVARSVCVRCCNNALAHFSLC